MTKFHIKNKAIVSIGAGIEQVDLIKTVKRMGFSVICVDKDKNAPGFKYSDHKLTLSTFDHAPILRELKKLQKQKKLVIVAVLTKSSGPPVIVTSKISSHFNVPGPSLSASEISTDKAKLITFCKKNNLPIPPSVVISKLPQKNIFTFPVIVKPALSQGGKKDVYLVSNKSELIKSFRSAKKNSYTGKVIIQKYIYGYDFVVFGYIHCSKVYNELVLQEINTVNDKKLVGLGYKVLRQKNEFENHLEGLYRKFIDSLKIKDGMLWLSVRLSQDNVPYIIESHLDFGGDSLINGLLPFSAENYSFISAGIKTFLFLFGYLGRSKLVLFI